MLSPANVILALKVAVAAVSVLFAAGIVAICCKRRRLHGKLNGAFLVLTVAAVLSLEAIIRVIDPLFYERLTPAARDALGVHLWFAVPAAIALPVQWVTGHKRSKLHVPLAILFTLLWIGTVYTGLGLPPE